MITPKKPCVLVMKTDVLLKRVAISLMDLEQELEVVVSEAIDLTDLEMDVSKINPDVVLFGESHPVAAKATLTQLLFSHPRLRVVIVSEKSNWLHIFDKEDKLMTSLDDLLTVIKVD